MQFIATLTLVCSWGALLLLHQRFFSLLLFYLRDPRRASDYVGMVYHSKKVYYGNLALWMFFTLAIQAFAGIALFAEREWGAALFLLALLVDLFVVLGMGSEDFSRVHFTDRTHWLLAPEIVFPRPWQRILLQPSLYLLITLGLLYVGGTLLQAG